MNQFLLWSPPLLRHRLTLSFLLLLGFLVSSLTVLGQTVTSDKDDYAPGEVATITGSGWTADSYVLVEFKEEPDYPDYHVYDVPVDSEGNFVLKYDIETRHLGVKFTVTAIGKQSGTIATAIFTDGNIGFTSVNIPNNTDVTVTVTYTPGSPANAVEKTDIIPFKSQNVGTVAAKDGTRILWTFNTVTSNGITYINTSSTGTQGFIVNGNLTGSNAIKGTYTVCTAPSFTTHPLSTSSTFTYGSNATFSVVAAGTAPLNYQWQVNSGAGFTNIANETGASLSLIKPAVFTNGYQYRCVVTNACGNATSNIATLNIKKADQTISLTTTPPANAMYNTGFTVVATASSGLPVAYTSIDPLSNVSNTYTMTSGTGVGSVLVKQGGDANYNAAPDVTIAVNAVKATQTINFAPLANKTFGEAAYDLNAIASSSLPVSFAVTGPATLSNNTLTLTGAGTVSVTASQSGDSNYQAATSILQAFTVAKAMANVELAGLNSTYDGSPKAVTATTNATGTSAFTITYEGAAGAPTNAGKYAVVATLVNDNFTGSASGFLDIAKATQTISFTNPGTQTYGNAPFDLDGSTSSSLPITFSVVSGNASLSGNTLTITGAGTVTVKAVQEGNSNYNSAADVQQTFAVNKATATISLTNLTHTFDGLAKSATVATNPAGLTGLSITYDGLNTAPINAGSYEVAATLDNANYQAQEANGTLVIDKADQVISWVNPAGITYGTPLSAVQLNAQVVTGDGALNYSPAIGTVLNAGSKTIRVTAAETANYKEATKKVTLAVEKAPLVVAADDASKTYGDANPEFTGTFNGVVNNDNITATFTSSATAASPAGQYSIVTNLIDPANQLGNYSITSTNGSLTIQKADLTVKADDQSKVYGSSNPNLTASYTGFVNGDDATMLGGELSLTTTATTASGVGTYAVMPSGLSSDNYTIQFVSGTLTVTKAPLTVITVAATKVYGEPNPAFTVSYDGFVLNQNESVLEGTLTFATLATMGSAVGTYNVMPTGLTSGNYSITFVKASLTITKAVLTISANDIMRVYGDANPAFTASYSGFKNGETLANSGVTGTPDLSTLALKNNPVGTYSIVANQGTLAAANYSFQFVEGHLTVTKAPLSVVANHVNRLCGQVNPTLTGVITGIKNSDAIIATYTTGADQNSPANTYLIVPALAGGALSNYSVTLTNGVLTIGGVTVDASANSTPQPLKNTATIVSIKVLATSGTVAINVPVTLYCDNRAAMVSFSNASGVASFDLGVLLSDVYKIRAVAGSGCAESVAYLPVYDPTGGFVTGGGWINSPAGAYKKDVTLTGKANFGFVAKYVKGSTIPDGSTEFQFQTGNLNFNSGAYEDMRLVIAGSKASYKGTGKINGAGNYGFLVSAIDGSPDKFRIKIWDKNNSDALVYDNNIVNTDESAEPATALGGGSIVIHSTNNKRLGVEAEPVVSSTAAIAYPNPFKDTFTLSIGTNRKGNTHLAMFDNLGKPVYNRIVAETEAEDGKVEINLANRNLGMYLLHIQTSTGQQVLKVMKSLR